MKFQPEIQKILKISTPSSSAKLHLYKVLPLKQLLINKSRFSTHSHILVDTQTVYYIAVKLDIHRFIYLLGPISIFIFRHKSLTTEPVIRGSSEKSKVITRTNISRQGWDDTYPQPSHSHTNPYQ